MPGAALFLCKSQDAVTVHLALGGAGPGSCKGLIPWAGHPPGERWT